MKHATYILMSVIIAVVPAMAGGQLPTGKTMGKESRVTGVAPVVAVPANIALTDVFVEGFNDSSATGVPPPNWIMINRDGNTGADTGWYSSVTTGGQGSLPPHEGLAFAADYYGTANGFYIDDYLVTPNTGGTPPPGTVDSLTFWLTARLSASGNYPDSLDVRVSTTGRNISDFTVRLGYVLAPKANWTRFAYSLPIAANRYVAFRYLIYDGGPSGTNSDKICLDDVRITRYSSSAVKEPGELPTGFAVRQNYPNPFNPSTNVAFDLPNAGFTVLKVYNILGEEIATLVNEQLAPGAYTARFDAVNLPTGVYLYKLTSGAYSATRRMLLVR